MTGITPQVAPAEHAQLEKSLREAVRGEVLTDNHSRWLYATDASLYEILPLAVVLPRDAADVRQTVRVCAQQQIPLIPRGSGTSLSGQPIGPGVVLDFSKYMNRILELDAERSLARVQPGVVLDDLNRAAAQYGLQFGPDVATSSRANIGGMIGNNSAGSRSVRHGKMIDHVLSTTVVLADGTTTEFRPVTPLERTELAQGESLLAGIYRQVERTIQTDREEILARYPRVLRRVSGYNLDAFVPEVAAAVLQPPSVQQVRAREEQLYPGADFNLSWLIVGAEGTLATVTEAVVQLVPLPRRRAILALHFESLETAIDVVRLVLQRQPSAIELFDGMIVDLARNSLEYRGYLDFVVGRPESLILVEITGESAAEINQQIESLQAELVGRPGLFHVMVATEPHLCDHIWACRKAALPLLMGVPGTRKPIAFVEDTAVDPAVLPEFVRRFREILDRYETGGAFYGHASVGCLHIRPLLDTRRREDVRRLEAISRDVCELVVEFGGSMSGEHGDGLARSYLNERLFGPRLYEAFRQVKRAFDPANIMNPGKVVDAPSPVENLRHAPGDSELPIQTTLDFSNQGGFHQAVALCNGAGVCRKQHGGTMCPSFMVTGDEEHSTRGRANALRLVLTGKVSATELTSQRMYETYDLCLQCKGCKAECPSNVDVAKMKAEFLSHYWQAHGTPLRVRAMAHVHRLNRLGSALAPLSNWANQLPGAALLRQRLLGVDRRRSLPKFHRQHLAKWFQRRENASPTAATRGEVLLLDDCLTSYCEPGVGQAAVTVLERAGYRVQLAGLPCCGRAMISKGLLSSAQNMAKENIARLLPSVRRGTRIVGVEPSCILTLADEYPELVSGSEAQEVARAARTLEMFLMEEDACPPLKPLAHHAVLHGHCHQKALVGVRHTESLLRRIPELQLQTLDSGCCGMAGSFGYEHYDLSMKIGERVLLPAVRHGTHEQVLAPGFSCRHQIQDGTGKVARHPIQLIAEQLQR